MLVTRAVLDDLTAEHAVAPSLADEVDRDGFARLPGVFDPATLATFAPTVEHAARASLQAQVPMAKRTVYQRAFLQEVNLWQRYEEIRALVFSSKLAQLAARALGVEGVRLYHDQALVKEGGGGHTPWHCDQYYWPLDTDRTITAWIPLVDVPQEMGPLRFSTGSHRVDLGRDVAIGDESDQAVRRHPRWRELPVNDEPARVGDITFHLGWTFHGADANNTDTDRLVFTVIYFADGTRLAEPRTSGQRFDHQIWLPDTTPGEVIDTWLNPIVWREDGAHEGVLDRVPAPANKIGTFDLPQPAL